MYNAFILTDKKMIKTIFSLYRMVWRRNVKSGLLNKNEKDFNRNPQINDYFKHKLTHEHP